MAPCLEQLPVELIERVVTLLDVEDIGKLRLVSRELRSKASQGSYLSHFTTRSVDLTKPSLDSLISILAEPNLSRKLKHLTITGLIFDAQNDSSALLPLRGEVWEPPLLSAVAPGFCRDKARGIAETNEASETRRRVAKLHLARAQHQMNVECEVYPELLKQAFNSIREFCANSTLETLKLSVMVEAGFNERYDLGVTDVRNNLSAHASYMFATTMNALVAASLPVRQLDIFSESRYCSLACTELAAFLGHTPAISLRTVASQVHGLSTSFSRISDYELESSSPICCDCNSRRLRRADAEIICHRHSCKFDEDDDNNCLSETSLTSFVSQFRNLATLDLHQYEIERISDKYNPIAFELLSRELRLPTLRKLILRGINADDKSILTFLRAHPELQSLDFRHVNLTDGQWQPIFSHIKTHMEKLQSIAFEDLFEHKRVDSVPMPSQPPPMLPPPPLMGLHGLGHMPPPPPPQLNVNTYLNTLMTFRLMNIPDDQIASSGLFKTNKVKVNAPWIAKADILYGFVSHAANRWKAEKKWDRERMREYGPPPDSLLEL